MFTNVLGVIHHASTVVSFYFVVVIYLSFSLFLTEEQEGVNPASGPIVQILYNFNTSFVPVFCISVNRENWEAMRGSV